jgi:hypothetical protein
MTCQTRPATIRHLDHEKHHLVRNPVADSRTIFLGWGPRLIV